MFLGEVVIEQGCPKATIPENVFSRANFLRKPPLDRSPKATILEKRIFKSKFLNKTAFRNDFFRNS